MTSLLIATFLLAGADPEPDSIPKGPPPRIMAIGGASDTFIGTVTEQVPVTIARAVTVTEGGKTVTKVINETVMRTVTRQISYSVKGAKGRTAGGKKLDAEEVARRLGKPQVVLISSDGKPVDPAYLRLYKPDTLVLEVSGAGGGFGGVGGTGVMPLPILPPLPKK